MFLWVPRQPCTRNNEMVDQVFKQGASNDIDELEFALGVSKTFSICLTGFFVFVVLPFISASWPRHLFVWLRMQNTRYLIQVWRYFKNLTIIKTRPAVYNNNPFLILLLLVNKMFFIFFSSILVSPTLFVTSRAQVKLTRKTANRRKN